MNPLEYLILGLLVVMVIGTWVLVGAIRRAEVGFENEHGFQLGIPSPMQSHHPLQTYAPAIPARANLPEFNQQKPSRRNRGSKPPMLPVNLSVSDLNPHTERKPRRQRKPAPTQAQVTHETPPPKSGSGADSSSS